MIYYGVELTVEKRLRFASNFGILTVVKNIASSCTNEQIQGAIELAKRNNRVHVQIYLEGLLFKKKLLALDKL